MVKKLLVLMTGITRPSTKQVYDNIINTQQTLSQYDCLYYVLTCDSSNAQSLVSQLKINNINIQIHLIPHIQEQIGGSRGNTYRMFKFNEILLDLVTKDLKDFDSIIRMRIDTELIKIDIPDQILDNSYYAPKAQCGGIFDNFGLAVPNTYKKIWNANGPNFDLLASEHVLDDWIVRQGIDKRDINFKLNLYQSNNEEIFGVPQWSKRNRIFEYQNKWLSY